MKPSPPTPSAATTASPQRQKGWGTVAVKKFALEEGMKEPLRGEERGKTLREGFHNPEFEARVRKKLKIIPLSLFSIR